MHDVPLLPRSHVRARSASWYVHAVDSYAACQVVTLTPLRDAASLGPLALIVPFDRITPVGRTIRWRRCGVAQLSAALARAILDTVACGAGHLLGPDLALVPWQWAAAAALLHGNTSTLLLADA